MPAVGIRAGMTDDTRDTLGGRVARAAGSKPVMTFTEQGIVIFVLFALGVVLILGVAMLINTLRLSGLLLSVLLFLGGVTALVVGLVHALHPYYRQRRR